MPTSCCRICGANFFEPPLLLIPNMPKAAQYLPRREDLASDAGMDIDLRQCSLCGLVQLTSDPVPYYKEVIRAVAVSEEMRAFREQQFAHFASRFGLANKKVLEIGAGRGEYLSIFSGTGARSYGLEGSADAVRQGRAAGLDLIHGFLVRPSDVISHAPFDAFYILNYLEHLPDINSVLRGICSNLAEDAVGLVEVPNFDMIVRKQLFSEFTSDHLYYFTQNTLRSSLAFNGFDVIECDEVWHDYILSAIVRRRRAMDLSPFESYRSGLTKQLNDFLSRYTPGKAAVWGAGHQALAVIAMTGIANKVRFVIDSAQFKQGCFTPVSHLPIVSPEVLQTEAIDAIVVMAASFSDEVARTILRNQAGRIDLAILRDHGIEEIKAIC